MIYVAIILYTMGAFLYNVFQMTVINLKDIKDYSTLNVTMDSVFWPIHVLEMMIHVLLNPDGDDEDDDDEGTQ
jgi:hypothetical protein